MCSICHNSPCLAGCPNRIDTPPKYIGMCVICGITLDTDHEAFCDEEDNLFCSIKCFKDNYGFTEVDYKKYQEE